MDKQHSRHYNQESQSRPIDVNALFNLHNRSMPNQEVQYSLSGKAQRPLDKMESYFELMNKSGVLFSSLEEQVVTQNLMIYKLSVALQKQANENAIMENRLREMKCQRDAITEQFGKVNLELQQLKQTFNSKIGSPRTSNAFQLQTREVRTDYSQFGIQSDGSMVVRKFEDIKERIENATKNMLSEFSSQVKEVRRFMHDSLTPMEGLQNSLKGAQPTIEELRNLMQVMLEAIKTVIETPSISEESEKKSSCLVPTSIQWQLYATFLSTHFNIGHDSAKEFVDRWGSLLQQCTDLDMENVVAVLMRKLPEVYSLAYSAQYSKSMDFLDFRRIIEEVDNHLQTNAQAYQKVVPDNQGQIPCSDTQIPSFDRKIPDAYQPVFHLDEMSSKFFGR